MKSGTILILALIAIILLFLLFVLLNIRKKGIIKSKLHSSIIKSVEIILKFRPNYTVKCPEDTHHPLHDLLSRCFDPETDTNEIIHLFVKYFYETAGKSEINTSVIFRMLIQELINEQLGFKSDLNGFWLGPGNSSSVDKPNTFTKNFLWLFKSNESMQKGYPYYFFGALPLINYKKSLKKSFRETIEQIITNYNLKKDFGVKGIQGPDLLILFFKEKCSAKNVDFSLYFDGYFLHCVCFNEFNNEYLVMEKNNPLNEISLRKYKEKECFVNFVVYKRMGVEVVK